jgi:hypothetical protein
LPKEGNMRLRLVECAALLVVLSGCGTITYGRGETYVENVVEMETRAVLVPGQAQPDRLVVVQPPPPQPPPPQIVQPPPPQIVQAPPPPMVGNAPVMCGAGQRLRVHNEVVDGRGGPAVIASGDCVVELSESIVRGPIHVGDNAQVVIVECRVEGDIHASPTARVDMRGSRHRGGRFHAGHPHHGGRFHGHRGGHVRF